MTEPAIYFNYRKFLEVLGQPEVETLKYMFERLGGSAVLDMNLDENNDEVLVIRSTQSDADAQIITNNLRLERRVSDLQNQNDILVMSVKKLERRINELEIQL